MRGLWGTRDEWRPQQQRRMWEERGSWAPRREWAPGRARGWGWNSEIVRMYDPETVQTREGQVLDVFTVAPRDAVGRGIHLQLRTRAGDIPVHLGPEWYLENQEIEIVPGDWITVTGSLVNFEGHEALIAARVARDHDVLDLRDARGFPRWAGWRQFER
jgi:hypothetical protein